MSAPRGEVTDPARALAEIGRKAGGGILSATRGKHKRLVCVRAGHLAHVASNVIEEQLEAYLVSKGIVTADRMRVLQRDAREEGVRASNLLLRNRELSPEKLYAAAADRSRLLVSSTIEWQDAVFEFSPGLPKLDSELTVEIPLAPLIFDHALEHPKSMPEVRRRIGPTDQRMLRSEHVKSVLIELELDEAARGVLELSDGFLTAAEIVARARGSAERAWRSIHALLAVGALRPVAEGEVPKTAVGEAVSREEMLARLGRDDSTHYSVLGLTEQASSDEIREAYYYLARRYHPDRHRMGELSDLLGSIEKFFTKVTEAYNTLIDPDRRSRYDEEVATPKISTATEPKQDTRSLAKQNFARGLLLTKKKQYHEALKFLENAVQLDASKAEYHLELGCVQALNPRSRNEAEKSLRDAIERNPSLTRAYFALGELFERADRTEEALQMFTEGLRWEPANADAQAAVSRLQAAARGKGLFRG